MAQYRWLYMRSIGLALVFGFAIAGIGILGDSLEVGPGTVPIWDPDGRGYWVTGLVLVLVTSLVYHRFDHPVLPLQRAESDAGVSDSGAELPTRWVFPALVILSIVLLLGVYRGTTAIAAGAFFGFAGLVTGILARHLMLDDDDQVRERARLVYTLTVHGVAFLSLSMIYIHKVRSIFSATAILIVGILLLLALTDGESALLNRRIVYALVGGIMLGQITWGLNYWQAAGWTGGAVLLVFFYFAGGLVLTHLRQGVQPRDVAEYGSVATIAFGIVVYSLFM